MRRTSHLCDGSANACVQLFVCAQGFCYFWGMAIRTIVVLCADCDTGYRLVRLAVKAGLQVIAAIRPYTEAERYIRMGADVIKIDPLKPADYDKLYAGLDPQELGVACILGGTPRLNSQGNMNAIDAAARAGVSRFLLQTSIGCGDSADAVDEIVKVFTGKALTAKTWAERHLQATALDWTIIRAGGVFRRNFKGGGILLESRTVSGHINPEELGDVILQALLSRKTSHRILAALDADEAHEIDGTPVVAAEI